MGLSSDRNTARRDGAQFEFPVAAAVTCYAGGIAVLSAGVVKPGVTATGLTAVGAFEERADNALGAASAINAKVRAGVFAFANSASTDAVTLSDVGNDCYIVDDQTVAKTSGVNTRSVAGKVRDVSATAVWVEIAPPKAAEVLETAVITITTAQLLALFTTAQTLVAAPGAGIALVPVSASLMLDYNSVAYDGIAAGEDLVVRYTDASGNIAGTIEATGFLDAAADAHREHDFSGTVTPTANAALMLHMATGNIATGNSPLKVLLRYRRVTLLT